MKLAIASIPFDFSTDANTFEADITEPGRPIYSFVSYEAPARLIKRASDHGMVPIGRLVVEVDPDREKRRRRFVVVPLNMEVEAPGPMTFVCCFTNPNNGAVVALYETSMPLAQVIERAAIGVADAGESAP